MSAAIIVFAKAPVAGLAKTRLAPALRTARQMLLDAPFSAAEIIVISDLQRSGAAGIAGIDLPAGVQLRSIPVGAATRANSAVRVIEARRVLDGVNLRLHAGQRVAVLGPNGAGKTTLLRAAAGVLSPARGATARAPRRRLGAALAP